MSLHEIKPTKGVNVLLDPSDLNQVVGYLISNQIGFSVEYQISEPAPTHPPLSTEKKKTRTKVRSSDVISRIYEEYIEKIGSSLPPSEATIAQQYGLKATSFKYKFKHRFGKTFSQLYMEKKMDYAAFLLRKGHKAVTVSAMIGYGERSAIKFNKMFQKHFGITPKKYQINHWIKTGLIRNARS